MTTPNKAVFAVAGSVASIGGAIWICLVILDRMEARVEKAAEQKTTTALTIQGIAKDLQKLDERQWKDQSELRTDIRELKDTASKMDRQLLTNELKSKPATP